MIAVFDVLAGTLAFFHQNFDAEVVKDIYAGAEELAQLINPRIQDRTAMLTGALKASEMYEVNTDPHSVDMIVFYAADSEQELMWGRTYARFIEGPDLGFSSPTIKNPSQMYARIETEDMDIVYAWGEARLDYAVRKLAINQGVTI